LYYLRRKKEMFCTHEEADSRMFFHLKCIEAPKNVILRTADTDCLIIALGIKHHYSPSLKVWLEVGVQHTQRFIDVNGLHDLLGEQLCKSLLAYHTLTGSDYTASFSRKGKVRPLKLLEKNHDAQKALAKIAFSDEINQETLATIEKFVCQIYGKKRVNEVNAVRLEIFMEKHKPRQSNLSYAKKLDASMLPPCKKFLSKR